MAKGIRSKVMKHWRTVQRQELADADSKKKEELYNRLMADIDNREPVIDTLGFKSMIHEKAGEVDVNGGETTVTSSSSSSSNNEEGGMDTTNDNNGPKKFTTKKTSKVVWRKGQAVRVKTVTSAGNQQPDLGPNISKSQIKKRRLAKSVRHTLKTKNRKTFRK